MDKKELIAEEFIDLFKKHNFEKINLAMLNDNIDFPVKNYFNNKYEILDYVLRDKLQEKIDLIKNLKEKNMSLQNKLIMFFDYHFDFLRKYPNVTDILIKTSMIEDDKKLVIIKSYMKNFKSTFSELIKDEIKKDKVRDVDPEIIASAILHATHGVTVRIKYDENYDYAKAKKELVNFIYLGLNN
ncbi:MAG TPA: hypothetical protein VJ907_06255 [Halanaerobiales bacterium]|nr:hypothetical protein [Halanaerobiales bacterium]